MATRISHPLPASTSIDGEPMGLLDAIGYRVLRFVSPPQGRSNAPEVRAQYVPRIKDVIGEEGWAELRGKTIVDFGCAHGAGTIEMAQNGAGHVIGVDIRLDCLEVARSDAAAAGVESMCAFKDRITEPVDAIVSLDAFEHFDDPAAILRIMHGMLKEGGMVLLSFGPTWYHPYGGHLFSVFPWSHVLITEAAQMRWRSEFKSDGATRIRDVEGGMNQLSIKKLLEVIEASDFLVEYEHLVPIRPLRWAHNRLTRELTTSVVQCILRKAPVAAKQAAQRA
jgi:SAM-dependent methyltransferase